MVFSARQLSLMRTNLLSSGTQMRLVWRFGEIVRFTTLVTWRPMPPFFLANPERWILPPERTRVPRMLQIRAMIKIRWLRDAENGREDQPVKTNSDNFRLKSLQAVFAKLIHPAFDVAENGVLFRVIHQQMVSVRVIVIGL